MTCSWLLIGQRPETNNNHVGLGGIAEGGKCCLTKTLPWTMLCVKLWIWLRLGNIGSKFLHLVGLAWVEWETWYFSLVFYAQITNKLRGYGALPLDLDSGSAPIPPLGSHSALAMNVRSKIFLKIIPDARYYRPQYIGFNAKEKDNVYVYIQRMTWKKIDPIYHSIQILWRRSPDYTDVFRLGLVLETFFGFNNIITVFDSVLY